MTLGAWKVTGIGLALVLLLVFGGAGGAWLAACHYRPLLDTANTGLASAKQARDNLEVLSGEQGRKLGELVSAGELRERNASLALAKAKKFSQSDYAAANKLLLERTGGDPVKAVESVIDEELGL